MIKRAMKGAQIVCFFSFLFIVQPLILSTGVGDDQMGNEESTNSMLFLAFYLLSNHSVYLQV